MLTSLFSQNSYAAVQRSVMGVSGQQVDAIKSVLSNYDANNISTKDAKNIATEVKELGIAPGRTLAIVFAGEGFDAAKIGEAGAVGGTDRAAGQRPPPPGSGEGGQKGHINTEAVAALTLLLEANESDDISDDQWSSFYEELEAKGVDATQPFIDLKL